MTRTYHNQADWSRADQATPEIVKELDVYRTILEGSRNGTGDRDLSQGEFIRLADLADYIPLDDVELLEAAGIPEFEPDTLALKHAMDTAIIEYIVACTEVNSGDIDTSAITESIDDAIGMLGGTPAQE